MQVIKYSHDDLHAWKKPTDIRHGSTGQGPPTARRTGASRRCEPLG